MAVVFREAISVLESLSHTRQEAKKSKGKRVVIQNTWRKALLGLHL